MRVIAAAEIDVSRGMSLQGSTDKDQAVFDNSSAWNWEIRGREAAEIA